MSFALTFTLFLISYITCILFPTFLHWNLSLHKQWAAVRTHNLLIRLPPQFLVSTPLVKTIKANQGVCSALQPPTTLVLLNWKTLENLQIVWSRVAVSHQYKWESFWKFYKGWIKRLVCIQSTQTEKYMWPHLFTLNVWYL